MPLSDSPAWQALTALLPTFGKIHLRDLFAADPGRFDAFSVRHAGLLLDFSKQRVDSVVWSHLLSLAKQADVLAWQQRMVAGEAINHTEGRAVLHMALRANATDSFAADGKALGPCVQAVLTQMQGLCDALHAGQWRGFSGEGIRDVVNIGIGGSDLGPRMAAHALSAWHHPDIRVHFVSNVDGADLALTLRDLNPRTTLFIVTSKTFTTPETLLNAQAAKNWLLAASGNEDSVPQHFVAVSANPEAAQVFGIPPEQVFSFWDWVGGRFSVWSAVGLPLAIAIGFEGFQSFLAGARAMDDHFVSAPLENNMPVVLALLALWNRSFLGASTQAILPYSQSLEWLPAYLQQLEMESNGKQMGRDGVPVNVPTAPVIWGAAGTNGQHSFYQCLHQGGQCVPSDFILIGKPDHALPGHHPLLLSNALAQSAALAFGQTESAVAELEPRVSLRPYQIFPGNQPSNTLLLDQLDPFSLGQLLALYEHKVFCLGVLWGLNSFDQWGVELGKRLSSRLLPCLSEGGRVEGLDVSTQGLLAALQGKGA